MARIDIRNGNLMKNESLIKVNIKRKILKVDTFEKVVLNLPTLIIKTSRKNRKIELIICQIVRKRGAVWKDGGLKRATNE